MHRMVLTREGRQNLSHIFTLNPPWTSDSNVSDIDVQYFFSNIYSQFQGAVQYSGDNREGYSDGHGIPDMCAIMTNDSYGNPIENIAAFNKYMTIFYQDGGDFEGTDNSYAEFIKHMKNYQNQSPGKFCPNPKYRCHSKRRKGQVVKR
ncbi:hypothetical protein GCK32_017808 [Trichostrongylus colubriformis]|uniref:Uncharacterized protein n=1 Tax=Trichostrongylus colubriformis TaxID=6319 RepID=A0AAN8FH40_TRICO